MAPWFKALGARCKAETGRYSRGTFRKANPLKWTVKGLERPKGGQP
jgi:hypothetical protein